MGCTLVVLKNQAHGRQMKSYAQAGLHLCCSHIPEHRFSYVEAHIPTVVHIQGFLP